MLHIEILAVGKLKERFWADACSEYLKRLGPYASVKVREIADVDPKRAGGEAAAVEAEGTAILDAIPRDDHLILLDISGKELSSEGIALRLDELALAGRSNMAIAIGGSCGVSDAVRARADERWSFGKITLPHNLARVVLLEQLYRGFKINRGEPYHK